MRIKTILPSVSLGAAAGAVYYFLQKRSSAKSDSAKPAKAVSTLSADLKTGTYSFISGFQDAVTVELTFSYIPEKHIYSIREDDFLVESDDSHVGVLEGENFSLQLEYAVYYAGEDYQKLTEELAVKHHDLTPISYGSNVGVMYQSGDNLSLVFPIPEDTHSYLHVTLVKAAGNDDALEMLPTYQEVEMILRSMKFSRV
ncbi:MAG: hypothetical protein K6C12_05370 [Oscillospiraceae bacterium]|nr:hypothetical protein [Oscillospiraceae bacterium]